MSKLCDLGIRNVDIAVVSVGLLEQSVMATLILKEMGVPCIVCKAVSRLMELSWRN